MKRRFLILASGSPRRKSLMREAGYRFEVVSSDVSEDVAGRPAPSRLVTRLALRKAVAVSKARPDAVVLGADTIVFIHSRVVGKPANAAHAVRILKTLSGRWQRVYTGVAVVWDGGKRRKVGYAVSRVLLRPLTGEQIRRASTHHLDKAGAYAVQEEEDPFVDRIEGDYDNVVGLPMRLVKKLLTGAL